MKCDEVVKLYDGVMCMRMKMWMCVDASWGRGMQSGAAGPEAARTEDGRPVVSRRTGSCRMLFPRPELMIWSPGWGSRCDACPWVRLPNALGVNAYPALGLPPLCGRRIVWSVNLECVREGGVRQERPELQAIHYKQSTISSGCRLSLATESG